jgi:hypothetical protein
MVVDHRVWLEHVAANLAAERDIGLGRVQGGLLGGLAVRLELVQPVLQHLHRSRLVLELRPLLLRGHDDAAREMGDADRGAGLVDVLATRA